MNDEKGDVSMDNSKIAIQDLYPDDFAWCFGCGRLNEDGYHFRTCWHDEGTLSVFEPSVKHMAIAGFVYGGLLASFIDCHGTGSASLFLHRKNGHEPGDGVEPPRFVTASLHVDYMKPTIQGVKLKAVGKVEEVHPKKYKVHVKVYAGEEHVANGEVVAAVMPASFGKK